MRKTFLLLLRLFAASITVKAEESPKCEAWVTASLFRADIDILDNETLHGYGLGAQWNLRPYFGIAGEFTSNHGASGPVSIFVPGAIVVIPDLDTTVRVFVGG